MRKPHRYLCLALMIGLFLASATVGADTLLDGHTPIEIRKLLDTSFGKASHQKYLWLTGNRKEKVKAILGRAYGSVRAPYWQSDVGDSQSKIPQKTLWILDGVSKSEAITVAVLIKDKKIEVLKVVPTNLSRSMELTRPEFTRQFEGIAVDHKILNRNIDGISGASISVRETINLVNLALYLHLELERN